ncbi:hypothetical protein KUCAC02_009135, partial [Chaenocephalus aceratus]
RQNQRLHRCERNTHCDKAGPHPARLTHQSSGVQQKGKSSQGEEEESRMKMVRRHTDKQRQSA